MDRIELNNLTRTYYDAQGETFCALDHASLIWEQGHSIAIMGESGSGKSTLARLMIGLERPSEGRVLINDIDTTKWGLREWRKYRGKIQAVFQDAGGTLNPAWSTHQMDMIVYNTDKIADYNFASDYAFLDVTQITPAE